MGVSFFHFCRFIKTLNVEEHEILFFKSYTITFSNSINNELNIP